jgi:hypothetical protein
LAKSNYEARKQFYLNLFSGYDKKEYYFSQIEFQKRLVEEFKEKGQEICDNNKDDNENGAIDCADEQCGGKICGKGKNILQEGNGTREVEADFYCIEKECKAREEIREIVRNVSVVCLELPPIECAEGSKAFFSRYDNETNCPLETSCLNETESCKANEDCKQPACGIAECIENKCKLTKLTECKKLECADGDERICELDGKIVGICSDGFWQKTGECERKPEIRNETVVGNECSSANDCGSDNVCNNGVCQVLPRIIMPIEERPEEAEEKKEEAEEQKTQEQTPEQTQNEQEPQITGNIIFNFIGTLFSRIKIMGAAITGFDTEGTGSAEQASSPESSQQPSETSQQESQQETRPSQQQEQPSQGIQQPENQQVQEQQMQDSRPREENREQERREDNRGYEQRRQEDERRNQENKERCRKECARPCIEKCIRAECGEEMECSVDEVQKKCEGTCEAKDDCIEKCMKGGDWWKEFENKDEHKEEKGVFQIGGNCRTSQGKTEGFIWFGGWGESFEQIQELKNKYYSGGQADWCKYDFENLKKQRQEFEKGFNQEFVRWFFEKYLANSAENWEQSVAGIFELYWKDVDNSREMVYRMDCLGINELPSVNLINVKYETDYGSVEFWEEIRTVKLPGMDKEAQIISPYMKAWVFPPKEFIIYEMQEAMKNHEFPGSPEEKMERKNEEGPTAEEREMIKQNEKFMNQIKEISEKYNGNLDIVIQFKDYETNKTVFNLYGQVNENDIIKIEPMLPEEVVSEDVKVEVDFKIIYEMIYEQEKEMRGGVTESPPWDRKIRPMQKIKELTNGVKMYFKMRKIMSSAKITPAEAEKDVKNLFKKFMSMMMKEKSSGGSSKEEPENKAAESGAEDVKDVEGGVWQSKELVTGEIILD